MKLCFPFSNAAISQYSFCYCCLFPSLVYFLEGLSLISICCLCPHALLTVFVRSKVLLEEHLGCPKHGIIFSVKRKLWQFLFPFVTFPPFSHLIVQDLNTSVWMERTGINISFWILEEILVSTVFALGLLCVDASMVMHGPVYGLQDFYH